MPKGFKIFGLVLAIIIILLLIPYPRSPICSWDFRNCLWSPAYMVVRGESAYSTNMPYSDIPPTWLPMATGVLFFIGWLPCHAAAKIWFMLEMTGLGLILWLAWGRSLPTPRLFLVSLLAVFLNPALYLHFKNGQFTILFITMMMAVVFLPLPGRWRTLILAIGMTKPQLCFLVYPGILLAEYRDHGMKAAVRLVLHTALWAVLLMVPLFIAYPDWPADLLASLNHYGGSPWDNPTLFMQLPELLGPAGRVLWASIFLCALAISNGLWWRADSKTALMWSLALTPVATPYTWSYDFVLLLPAFVWLLVQFRGAPARILLSAGTLLVYAGIVAQRWRTEIADGVQWWVPSTMVLIFLAALLVDRKKHQSALPGRVSRPDTANM